MTMKRINNNMINSARDQSSRCHRLRWRTVNTVLQQYSVRLVQPSRELPDFCVFDVHWCTLLQSVLTPSWVWRTAKDDYARSVKAPLCRTRRYFPSGERDHSQYLNYLDYLIACSVVAHNKILFRLRFAPGKSDRRSTLELRAYPLWDLPDANVHYSTST